jgi:6,7-dimethyl-8-ribityllumazine synthase
VPNELPDDGPLPECQLAVVVSKYNHSITKKLLDGAIETLTSAGLPSSAIDVAWVPGAWEIPIVAQKMAQSGNYAAILTLGAVIRGETTHDQYINQQVSSGLSRIALDHQIPVLFGILTCNSLEQAIHRSGGQAGNKGQECAQAALDMVRLLSRLA